MWRPNLWDIRIMTDFSKTNQSIAKIIAALKTSAELRRLTPDVMADIPKSCPQQIFGNHGRYSEIMADIPKSWQMFQNHGRYSKILADVPKSWQNFADVDFAITLLTYLFFLYFYSKDKSNLSLIKITIYDIYIQKSTVILALYLRIHHNWSPLFVRVLRGTRPFGASVAATPSFPPKIRFLSKNKNHE